MTSAALPTPPPSTSLPSHPLTAHSRPLSPNERSYFLPSRSSGVNDMYLHHHLRLPSSVDDAKPTLTAERIGLAWAILRGRHGLLGARVERTAHEAGWAFVSDPAPSADEALAQALQTVECSTAPDGLTGEDRIRAYLNGPRTLSSTLLAKLVVARAPRSDLALGGAARLDDGAARAKARDEEEEEGEGEEAFDVLLLATHYVADGLALHALANELYGLAFGPPGRKGEGESGTLVRDVGELREVLEKEVAERNANPSANALPQSADDRLATYLDGGFAAPSARATSSADAAQAAEGGVSERFDAPKAWKRAVGKTLHGLAVERGVGGQTLSRSSPSPTAEDATPRTHVDTLAFSPEDTAAMLRACKARGVNVGQAVVGGLNVAWARLKAKGLKAEEPALFYSAMSVRPFFPAAGAESPSPSESFVHLALGYYTLSLPCFLLPSGRALAAPVVEEEGSSTSDLALTVFHRARSVKLQTAQATVKRWSTAARVLGEMEARGERAEGWARKDDDEAEAKAKAKEDKGLVGLGLGVVMNQGSVDRQPADADPKTTVLSPPLTAPPTPATPARLSSPPTNAPLLGLSLLGNLDAIYTPSRTYPSVRLTRLTTGSRQRLGGSLVFVYSFAGRLSVSLGWETTALGGPSGELGWWWDETKKVLVEVLLERMSGDEGLVGADRFVV